MGRGLRLFEFANHESEVSKSRQRAMLLHYFYFFSKVILANEIGYNEARNTFALEFRRIDIEQNHTSSCSADFCNSL